MIDISESALPLSSCLAGNVVLYSVDSATGLLSSQFTFLLHAQHSPFLKMLTEASFLPRSADILSSLLRHYSDWMQFGWLMVRFSAGTKKLFFAKKKKADCGARPSSCQWVSGAPSWGQNRPGREDNHADSSGAKFNSAWSYTSTSHTPSWRVQGKIYLHLYLLPYCPANALRGLSLVQETDFALKSNRQNYRNVLYFKLLDFVRREFS